MLDVFVGDFHGKALYDPGSNASTISYDAFRRLKKFSMISAKEKFHTVNGSGNILGITLLPLKILNINKKAIIYVIDSLNCKYDFIIGLDLISSFKLNFHHTLTVSQHPIEIEKSVASSKKINLNWHEFMSFETLEKKISHLDYQKCNIIKDIIKEFSDVFAKNKYDNGKVTKYECAISLLKDKFIRKKPYRCTYEDQQEIETQVSALLEKGMIIESNSPFASPVTMQFKKVGLGIKKEKTRMCTDYRELNKLIVPENYPFPLIEEIITLTNGCSWFSAFDINAAFWTIPLKPEDRHKTAFITQNNLYEWTVMPFGMKNSSACFQRILSGIIHRRKLSKFCINYIDDILIFSRTFEEHIRHIRLLIQAILEEGFKLNFKKCNFAMSTIPYLGHLISSDSVKPLFDNLAAIDAFPRPSSRRNIRQFLGKINFYRKFIPNSVSLLEPFHQLLRKNVPFKWSTECQASFDKVRRLLSSEPILAIFDRAKPIIIYSDASGLGIGAVLKQIQTDGTERPVAYFSKKLSDAQKKRTAIYIESLAIREAVRYWRFWLIGRPFTIITDHKPLQYLNLKARTDEELGDLAHELLQLDFQILYRPGSSNSEADYLSRNPVLPSSSDSEAHIFPSFNFLSLDDIRNLQSNVTRSSTMFENHGILYKKIRNKNRIILDKSLGKVIVEKIHKLFGHIGTKHVLTIISKQFYFPKMYNIVKHVCSSCTICIKNKTRRPRRSGKLGFFGPATSPYEIMSLDTIGGFGQNHSSNTYLHLLVDHFTRHAFILCSKGQSAREMVSLVDSVHQCHPIGILMTDQYGGLSSDEFQSYCESAGIRHVFSAVDSAFSMGLNERLNQTLVNRIRCVKHDDITPVSKSWTTIAKQCVQQYNNSPHSVTKFAPSYLLTGQRNNILPDLISSSPNLSRDRSLALERTIKYHNYNKSRYDKNKNVSNFKIGDLVYIDNGNKLNRKKLDPVRIGPYRITKKLSDVIFEVQIGHGPHPYRLYHANKLLLPPSDDCIL